MLREVVKLVFNFLSHDSKKEMQRRENSPMRHSVEPKKAFICTLVYSRELQVQIYTHIYTKNTEVQTNPKL